MATDLPLVARDLELATVADVLDAAVRRRGRSVLITGEAGIGKTRLLREVRTEAERRGLLVLAGRAVESSGAYRPLVEAFARPAASFASHPDLVGVRPTLARLLPGWVAQDAVLAPMADPAAVLAEALILLLQVMAPNGAALVLDDLHWADPDTLSVLASLADAVDTLPLAMVLAARTEAPTPAALHQLGAGGSIRVVPLRRLTPDEVCGALRGLQLPRLAGGQMDHLVAVVDGLPLVLDEVVRQLQETGSADRLDLSRTSLASAVQLRLAGVSADSRLVLDALSVVGDTDAEVIAGATGLELGRIGPALRDGVASTLLITAHTPLGVAWRHMLIGEAVRELLLPLERQSIAQRAADRLAQLQTPDEGQLRQAARLYELAGHPDWAAQQLIRAAHLAVANAALDVADQHLAEAQALTGHVPVTARDVLVERIETLIVAGRAADAYDSGAASLYEFDSTRDRGLLVATARAAFATGSYQEGRKLLDKLEYESEPLDCHVAVLRAHAAYAERQPEAVDLGEHAASRAQQEGRADLACEALVVAGVAARRIDTERAVHAFRQAIAIGQRHSLPIWEVRAQAELGVIDVMTDSDPTRLEHARQLATAAGMVGTVAEIDARICEAIVMRRGFVAIYPRALRAAAQARQLHLTELHARANSYVVMCSLLTDQPPDDPTCTGRVVDIKAVVAEAIRVTGNAVEAWPAALGLRAWLQGDTSTAIRTLDESLQPYQHQVRRLPMWGFLGLLRVADGLDPDEAFGTIDRTGHHGNWAGRALGTAIWHLRAGQPVEAELAEAEHFLRNTPFFRHMLRTAAAPRAFDAGLTAAEGWLREADAYFAAAGERMFQRRARRDLAAIGVKVPRTGASRVSPHLARLGITAREAEILQLVNSGLSNLEIAERLFISARTVETHVSNILQKTGRERRDQLPAAIEPPTD